MFSYCTRVYARNNKTVINNDNDNKKKKIKNTAPLRTYRVPILYI